eukprot:EC716325.1.p2 GENE.EC716325.1~~EC716325.1.p2  ORF type:complete len:78 (+),score=12.57 EC716325.1:50-283(+)
MAMAQDLYDSQRQQLIAEIGDSLGELSRNMQTLTGNLRELLGGNAALDELAGRWLHVRSALEAVASSRPVAAVPMQE